MMLVQRLNESYIDQFVTVVDEYREFCGFSSSPVETKEFFLKLLKNNGATTLIAVSAGDEVMGFINLYPSNSTLSLKKIWILNDLGVSSRFRRQGVAQELIKEAIEFVRQSGAIRIELKTEKTNINAQKLYKEIGFEIDQDNLYYRVTMA